MLVPSLLLLLPTFTHGWTCDKMDMQGPPPQLSQYMYYCEPLGSIPATHNACKGMGCSGGTPNCRPVSPVTNTASFRCPQIFSATICEDTYGSISCPDNQTIVILKATYGRPYAHPTCSAGSSGEPDPPCSADATMHAKECDGQNTCGGVVNMTDPEPIGFTDPCPGYTSFIEVDYICTPPVLTVIGCEDVYTSLICPGNLKMVIKKATYGRLHPEPTCPPGGPEPASPCSMDVTATISQYCVGNNTCSGAPNFIDPAWPDAHDPCPGLTSFVEIEYVCVPEVFTSTACEDTYGSMSCPDNQTIVILKAIYGRPYAHPTCSPGASGEPGEPCYIDITSDIAGCGTNICEGELNHIDPEYPELTDPCPGFTSFADVKYWCAPAEASTVDVEYVTFEDCDCQA